ncbi:MAG TPA: AAA family ATPase, partial [Acidimicrobiia bacterium]|nr:AAA family ATPase [Acidimicrobiia bacterium]
MGEGGVTGSRSVAVVLFTDLVGSTEMRSRLGEQAADDLRHAHDQLVTEAVEAHGGRLVKGLGDGFMAVFAGASDAVGAATAIQQALDRHCRGGSVALSVRIGISAGDVAFEAGDCFGTPVIEAARLCAAAQGGEILGSEMVRWLARSGKAVFTPVGDLELKGLAEPVPAVRVEWDPLAVASLPLPILLTEVGRIFVGRDGDLQRLTQLWKEAAAGERRLVLVAGEPGVGKTRLAAEVAARVHHEGAAVLAGRCDEDLGVPYQPFVEALRHFVDHTPAEDLCRQLGRYGGELVRLVPELAERATDLSTPLRSDPETEQYRLFDAVAAWLGVVTTAAPFLFVLDDLQWAAKPTLLLLRHVVRSPEAKRILFLGTYRDSELSHNHPLVDVLAELRRQEGVERVSLAGLDSSGVVAFMEHAAGHTLDDEDVHLARVIHDETEGNPFFIREVLRHLAETGAIGQGEGRWRSHLSVDDLGIPEGVRDVVGRRLSRLSAEANGVLRTAAVIGPEFELPVLRAALAGSDEEALLSALEEATEARLIMEGVVPRYRFTHALVRETLYGDLSAARRTALHRSVAEAIEAVHAGAIDEQVSALAIHWARACAPTAETSRAIEYATRAGDRALAQLAPDEAAGWYRQALELLSLVGDHADQRCRLLIYLGEAQRRAGEPAHRETLLEAGRLARGLGDADLAAGAALANRRGLFSRVGAVDEERVAALEAALAAVGPGESVVRARLLAALSSELHFAGEERRVALAREALGIARQLGESSTLGETVLAVWLATRDPAARDERSRLAAELAEISGAVDDPVVKFHSGLAVFLTGSECGDMAAADHGLALCIRTAEDLAQPVLRWRAAYLQAHRAFVDGHFDEVERWAAEALQRGEAAGQPDAVALSHSSLFFLRLLQGRSAEAAELIRPLAERFGGAAVYPAALAWAYADAGWAEEARAIMARLRGETFAAMPRDYLWVITLAELSRATARLGDALAAEDLYQLLRPHSTAISIGQTVWAGPVEYDLGLLARTLGRFAEANAHFAAAVEAHARIGVRGMLAHTYLEWARLLLTRGEPQDAERAREFLERAGRPAGNSASPTSRGRRSPSSASDLFELLLEDPGRYRAEQVAGDRAVGPDEERGRR